MRRIIFALLATLLLAEPALLSAVDAQRGCASDPQDIICRVPPPPQPFSEAKKAAFAAHIMAEEHQIIELALPRRSAENCRKAAALAVSKGRYDLKRWAEKHCVDQLTNK